MTPAKAVGRPGERARKRAEARAVASPELPVLVISGSLKPCPDGVGVSNVTLSPDPDSRVIKDVNDPDSPTLRTPICTMGNVSIRGGSRGMGSFGRTSDMVFNPWVSC